MRKTFLALLSVVSVIVCVSAMVRAQGETPAKSATAATASSGAAATPVTITATTSPIDLARAALAAQGGDKFKNLKSMVLTGTVDLYPPNSTQSIPGRFYIVQA